MTDRPDAELVERLAAYDRVLEVGIGERTDLAAALVETGVSVVAVDISRVELPSGVSFHQGDVHELDPETVDDPDAVVARRLPPELHRSTARLAGRCRADLYFTTLGGEFPAVDVETITGSSTTIYHRPTDSDTVL